MNLAGAQKLNESFFLVGEDAWFHQDNEADLTSLMVDGRVGGLLLACSAQRAHDQEKHPAQYTKQTTCKPPKWASAHGMRNEFLTHRFG